MATPNTLGLDFDQLNVQNVEEAAQTQSETTFQNDPAPASPPLSAEKEQVADSTQPQKKAKNKPYINTDRVKTGGSQRDKLSEEALAERMARMKQQNEKIKQRRIDVQADEEAFHRTQKLERAKIAQARKVQENVDRTREQNAQMKMDKIQSREWDSGKPSSDWKHKQGDATSATLIAEGDQTMGPVTHKATVSSRSAGTSPTGKTPGTRQSKGRGRTRSNPTTSTSVQEITIPAPPNLPRAKNTANAVEGV